MIRKTMLLCSALVFGLALTAADFTVPAKFAAKLGGVSSVKHTFGNYAQQANASRPDGFAFQWDRTKGKYTGVILQLAKPLNLEGKALQFKARGKNAPGGIYVRAYNKGENKAAWSVASWGRPAGKNWGSLIVQRGGSMELQWDPEYAVGGKAVNVDRLFFIIGEADKKSGVFDLEIADLQVVTPREGITKMSKVAVLDRKADFRSALILHPDTDAGRAAAKAVAAAIPGAKTKAGTANDRMPAGGNVIMLGNIYNNPAMLTLYARQQAPADESFPGEGNYFVSVIPEAFRVHQSFAVLGASDDAGLAAGAKVLAGALRKANGVLDAAYFATNRERPAVKPDHIAQGMKIAEKRLATGQHTSLGGYLDQIGARYVANHRSEDARLYVEVCRLYAKSAVADARRFGGAWGFDSDFMSFGALNGWDAVEHDPALTDQDRLDATRCLARWLVEAIVAEAKGGLSGTGAVHNHLTFCTQGTLVGAYYFRKYYPDQPEPKDWEKIAKHNFGRQKLITKAIDDCNGYQWHVWNHLMNYTLAAPDYSFITSGTGEKVMRSMLITMDNYGIQVPYGDTGSWKCWFSELPVLQKYIAATGSDLAKYILSRKGAWGKRPLGTWGKLPKGQNSFYGELHDVKEPQGYSGVQKLELEKKYYDCASATAGMPFEKCFDKISMRAGFSPEDFYILFDGLNNGNHKHADGNSILRHTQYDRIWLADNDYYKSQQKFHNTLLLNIDGAAGTLDPYIEYLGHGDTPVYGWCAGKARKIAGTADWSRYVIWLKAEKAYAVLDAVTVSKAARVQMKQRWNSLGSVTRKADGAEFEQNGPAMRFQGIPENRYAMADDYELGVNWVGYPHADKVVRVLDQISERPLKSGETAMTGGVWHGGKDGKIAPWRVTALKNGMTVDTGSKAYTITVDAAGKLNVRETASAGKIADKAADDKAEIKLPGKALRELFVDRKSKSGLFRYTQPLYAKLFPYTLTGSESKVPNALIPEAKNVRAALTDGSWCEADDSIMLAANQTGDWTIAFQKPVTLSCVSVFCWWADNSSRGTRHQIKDISVYVDGKKAAFKDCSRAVYPNFGEARELALNFPPVSGKALRVVITPRSGSRLYVCELLPGGPAPKDIKLPDVFEEYTASAMIGSELVTGTKAGLLRFFDKSGKILRETDLKSGRINDIRTADVNGDGKPEILVGTDKQFLLLDSTGKELWTRAIEYYRRPPRVVAVRTADLNKDGKPEILLGCGNWRTYAFTAEGKMLWHYEVIHDTHTVTAFDIDRDGEIEVLCGTRYYYMSVLRPNGLRKWGAHFGPGCRAIEPVRTKNGAFNVAAGSDDGHVYFFTAQGKLITKFNTGDEVRVLAVPAAKGAQHLWAGSFNGYVYCFAADGKLLSYTAVPGEVTALLAQQDGSVLAGTGEGAVVRIAPGGKITGHFQLGGRISSLTAMPGWTAVTSCNGETAGFR